TYYWSKDREFAKIMDLPRRRPVSFELAMSVPRDAGECLSAHGWKLLDGLPLSRDPAWYREFICGSRAEFTVAKDHNVRLRSGWFSDRSACYLAASRPVITQDTAFGNIFPRVEGCSRSGTWTISCSRWTRSNRATRPTGAPRARLPRSTSQPRES